MTQIVSVLRSRTSGSSSLLVALAAIALSACGSDSGISVVNSEPGASPFISFVNLSGQDVPKLAGIEFTIAPKPGSVSKAVDVWYSIAALGNRGYVASDSVKLPVFGLYAGYANQVSLRLQFQDGSTQTLAINIPTPAYVDPTGIYSNSTIIKKRDAGSSLGFDFFFMKSFVGAPVVVDTDAEIRWAVPGVADATSSTFQDGEFVIGDPLAPTVYRLQLDGTLTESPVQSTAYKDFHHNIDPGKQGLFAEVDATSDGVTNLETTVAEINDSGSVLDQWDLAAILGAYMRSQGDDASAFVRPGVDWFHNNSTTYDPSDDSIIVSSRENFVVKIDYRTGNIRWILGDPTKYWYSFPSLRAKALTLTGGLYPIGQHAVSITSDGLLMLFNDGNGSLNQPAGAPAGQSRSYSAVSAYSIDEASMTAQEAWDFDYGQTLYSAFCGSAYESPGQSILVDYAQADNGTETRLVGLNSNHDVVFDIEYPNLMCDASWNALPIAFDDLTIN